MRSSASSCSSTRRRPTRWTLGLTPASAAHHVTVNNHLVSEQCSTYAAAVYFCHPHEMPCAQDIKLFINSPGGSVTAGMGIYDAMQVPARSVQS